MSYWLIKSEPDVWSWDDQVRAHSTSWEGVRNYQARNYLRAMQGGEEALFYHSGNERRIMGIVEITKPYHPDPTDSSGRFCMVEVQTLVPFSHPLSLARIKSDLRLQNLPLVRQSRLSVMPIDEKSWTILIELGKGET